MQKGKKSSAKLTGLFPLHILACRPRTQISPSFLVLMQIYGVHYLSLIQLMLSPWQQRSWYQLMLGTLCPYLSVRHQELTQTHRKQPNTNTTSQCPADSPGERLESVVRWDSPYNRLLLPGFGLTAHTQGCHKLCLSICYQLNSLSETPVSSLGISVKPEWLQAPSADRFPSESQHRFIERLFHKFQSSSSVPHSQELVEHRTLENQIPSSNSGVRGLGLFYES